MVMKKGLILFFVFMSISFVYSSCDLECFQAIENPVKLPLTLGTSSDTKELTLQNIIDTRILDYFNELEEIEINVSSNQSKVETWQINKIVDIFIYERGGIRKNNHTFGYYIVPEDDSLPSADQIFPLFKSTPSHDYETGQETGFDQSETSFKILGGYQGRKIGFFIQPHNSSDDPGNTLYYTQGALNQIVNQFHLKNRALVFSLEEQELCNSFIIAFEDGFAVGGDKDYNDFVIYVRLDDCLEIPGSACGTFETEGRCTNRALWTEDLLYRLQDFFPEYRKIDPDFCFNLPTKWQGVEGGKEIQLTECGCYWSSTPNDYGQQCFEKVNVSVRELSGYITKEECKLTNIYPAQQEYDYNRVNWTLNPNTPGLAGCYNATKLFGMPSKNTLNFFNIINLFFASLVIGIIYLVILKKR